MDLRVLRYFKTIVEEKTMHQAALKLNISQPPLSMEIRKLEEELNVELFHRVGRGLELTDAGKFLYKKSLDLLSMADSIQKELKNFDNYQVLRIGMMSSSYGLYSSGIMKKYQKLYPNVQFEIYEGNTYELMDKLNQNMIELAIIRTPYDNNRNFKIYELDKEPMVALGTKEFFDSNLPITIQELSKYPIIYYQRFEKLLENVFNKYDVGLKTNYKNQDTRTTLLLCEQGLGVGIVPKMATSLTHNMYVREIVEKDLITTPAVIHKNDIKLSLAAINFIKLLMKH